jgi:hypothetical protein
MVPENPEFAALQVIIETETDKVTAEDVEKAIRRRLASEPTDLFVKNSTVVLLVQHQVRGLPE